MIRITIVTITYNAERVLQRTLDSVLAQTYEGVEHLIVDGASKDGTLQLAEQYKAKSDVSDCGHKVIILSEPDHGIYDAMNKGLTQASGDYSWRKSYSVVNSTNSLLTNCLACSMVIRTL